MLIIHGSTPPEFQEILTPNALAFVEQLEREFGARRRELLQGRADRQRLLDAGTLPGFLDETANLRASEWEVGSIPDDLQNRRVEITGPTDRKMVINALNSGANVFMADFEDANSPTWDNLIQGHRNLRDAIEHTLSFSTPEKNYQLNEKTAVLFVRPRGWHLDEKHAQVDGRPVSASLFDFGLFLFHNADRLLKRGSGPYFYLPKLESHLEARLWNDVFNFAQDKLGIPRGSIKATVLVETILAAFEMDEILYELRDHIVALNAGRWDYIFSAIKKFSKRPEFLLPDRVQITMTVPFMRAYTELLVKTCHKRGAHAIGGMAAFIPSRKDAQVNEAALSKVREDKRRESADGFDGTWVAHPDLVPVAREVFDDVLKERPHQKERMREEVNVSAADLLNFNVPNSQITEAGMRLNINVALQYLDAWLRGSGAVGIYNLMEDAATAEICRAQLWQWIHHPTASLADGRKISESLYRQFLGEEIEKIKTFYGPQSYAVSKMDTAIELFDALVVSEQFAEFLTLSAYEKII
ncbi:MAG: Malate synthase A [Anaerolineales bacterium]|nr:Malate synthase A [Anaerolineales bacterium]WKZ46543.1 MAG: malate synthase A [Anaerolineales bacterium]